MNERERTAECFEAHRDHLRAVSYRMLGSLSEADDAVQEAWLRYARSETMGIENLGGWLTTVVARVCLNMLDLRRTRREEPIDPLIPDPIVSLDVEADPERELLLGEAIGMALLVVLDTLKPAERVAFVLHDAFAMRFDEIAPIVGRTPAAARQLASRARRKVRDATAHIERDRTRQRDVVRAFLAAARAGDLDGLLELLDPDVVLRSAFGAARPGGRSRIHGARDVASGATVATRLVRAAEVALVNGAAGIVSWGSDGRAYSVMAFTVARGRIVTIDVIVDPARVGRLGLPAVGN
jgi:RNA polymerase sigma-70 factor (ECF subfamily)